MEDDRHWHYSSSKSSIATTPSTEPLSAAGDASTDEE
jgi:hypothetical protein